MKAITTTLYVCGALMIAAAVMGAVDYSKASRKGMLDKLYKEEKNAAPSTAEKEISAEDYSRGAIDLPVSLKADAVNPVEKAPVKKAAPKKTKKKKRITVKEFSRKAIPEEVIILDSVTLKH